MPPEVDVQVVGGGPAGLAFALRAARAGLSVRVFERSRPPLDKPCGEGLMPDGLRRLAELGLPPESLPGRPFRGIRYLGRGSAAEGRFPGPGGLGVRRTVLHRQLLERAGAAGIELHWGVPVTGLAGSRVETPAGAFPGRFLVGADGLRSAVRRWAGLDGPAARRQRFGVRHHFAVAPWTDLVEVYWADGAEAYVTPVGDREVGVAMLWDRRRARGGFDLLLARFPDLARRLSGAPATSRDRGCGPLEQRVRTVCRGPVALLGDAAGYLDAITGEGLSLAFHQGAALVEAITAGDLARYRTVCRRLHRLPQALTRFLLAIERRPRRVERLIRLLARHPDLFDRALAVLARQAPLRSFGLRAVGRTALGLLWG